MDAGKSRRARRLWPISQRPAFATADGELNLI
jgi:hypothetical protein